MTSRISVELFVGVTPEMAQALAMACEFEGVKGSQFGRQAILEKLVRHGYMVHPAQKHATANSANTTR
jgi:hypothetical protein